MDNTKWDVFWDTVYKQAIVTWPIHTYDANATQLLCRATGVNITDDATRLSPTVADSWLASESTRKCELTVVESTLL